MYQSLFLLEDVFQHVLPDHKAITHFMYKCVNVDMCFEQFYLRLSDFSLRQVKTTAITYICWQLMQIHYVCNTLMHSKVENNTFPSSLFSDYDFMLFVIWKSFLFVNIFEIVGVYKEVMALLRIW